MIYFDHSVDFLTCSVKTPQVTGESEKFYKERAHLAYLNDACDNRALLVSVVFHIHLFFRTSSTCPNYLVHLSISAVTVRDRLCRSFSEEPVLVYLTSEFSINHLSLPEPTSVRLSSGNSHLLNLCLASERKDKTHEDIVFPVSAPPISTYIGATPVIICAISTGRIFFFSVFCSTISKLFSEFVE